MTSEKIKAVDKSNMLNFCVDSAKLYGEAAKLAEKIRVNYPKPDNIIVAGMGGSGIGGDFSKTGQETKPLCPLKLTANTPASIRRQKNPGFSIQLFRRHRGILRRFS